MVYLNPNIKTTQTTTQSSSPHLDVKAPEELTRRQSDIPLCYVAQMLSGLYLQERQVKDVPQDVKTRLLVDTIEILLRNALDIKAVISIFEDIKGLCSLEKDHRAYFTLHFKPIIEKIAAEKSESMAVQKFVSQINALQDPVIAEMLGLRYCCLLKSSKDLDAFCKSGSYITKLATKEYSTGYGFKIGAAGARALARALKENQTLTSLDLSFNKIDIAGAEAIADALMRNQTLIRLDLSGNHFGDEGAKALARALKKNQILRYLELTHSEISNFGAKHLAEALLNNQTLNSLILVSNEIGVAGAMEIASALMKNQTLTRLDLRRNGFEYALDEAFKERKKSFPTCVIQLQVWDPIS